MTDYEYCFFRGIKIRMDKATGKMETSEDGKKWKLLNQCADTAVYIDNKIFFYAKEGLIEVTPC